MYGLIRPLLFGLAPERAHDIVIGMLALASRQPALCALLDRAWGRHVPAMPVNAMGLTFPNAVGLAAGLDKDARAAGALARLGFGHVELGTVTPRPQPGNPRPRLFRLEAGQALINRMGFNSGGVEAFTRRLREHPRSQALIGINIGKNADTPLERAAQDYLAGMRAVHQLADYIAINISSPNTPELRRLQDASALDTLLSALTAERDRLAAARARPLPLALKVSPDMEQAQIEHVAEAVLRYRIDGVIATNTTVQRPGLDNDRLGAETGGLSGRPLRALATGTLAALHTLLGDRVTLIGVGGILDPGDAREKIRAGATLVQLYTGFVLRGPALVAAVGHELASKNPA